MKNFRPVSNLSFMSKIVEKVVAKQLTEYLDCNNLLPKLQSGFRRFHSTETAVLKVLSDVCSAIDQGQVALLALLDVSAAFDTVDHTILLDRLSISYGISGTVHAWISSFVCGRSQTVHFGGTTSSSSKVRYGIPQGSTLGPLLYVLYTADVAKLVEKLGFKVHLYADDTQLYGYSSSSGSVSLAMNILSAIDSVKSWMSSNRLRLNYDKTQFIWFGTRQQLAKRDIHQLKAVSEALTSDDSVRNLGVLVDSELKFHEHFSKLSQNCFFQLRRMRSIRRSVSREAMLTLAHAFISSRVDFCNSLFLGVSSCLLDRLQSVMNATARLILNIPKFGHISDEIRANLHWLPVRQRISYKVCFLVRNCLAGAAPEYLREVCQSTSSTSGRQHFRSALRNDLLVPRVRTANYGARGFAVSGPRLWNSLPMSVRELYDKPEQFKKALKTFLMQQ